jgi:hypothetical protein
MSSARKLLGAAAVAFVLMAAMFGSNAPLRAQEAVVIAISVKNHQFQPAQVRAPANRPITLRVRNLDTVAMEFESVSLRVEKVVAPNSEGIINVRALAPGSYEFFDDFHQQTRGTLIVQ